MEAWDGVSDGQQRFKEEDDREEEKRWWLGFMSGWLISGSVLCEVAGWLCVWLYVPEP